MLLYTYIHTHTHIHVRIHIHIQLINKNKVFKRSVSWLVSVNLTQIKYLGKRKILFEKMPPMRLASGQSVEHYLINE